MDSSSKANTSEEDLYGDIDTMFLSQTDGEAPETTESTIVSTTQSTVGTTSQDETDDNPSDAVDDTVNDLDLYDDLIVEEGQQKIDSFQEMEKKYKQIIQENLALREKISKKESDAKAMQKNFSSLLVTAKGEISRKERELTNLRTRLSSSPGSLFKYRIPRKTAKETPCSTSVDSDFDPLFVSSPNTRRLGKDAERSQNKHFRNTNSPSKHDKNSGDVRKERNSDDRIRRKRQSNSQSKDRNDRSKKRGETRKESVSETESSVRKEKHDGVSLRHGNGNKSSEQNNEEILKGVNEKVIKNEKESERHRDNDRHKELERGNETRQSGDERSDKRRLVREQVNSKNHDDENYKVSGTKEYGKETRNIDLREKLRLKRLGIQSGSNKDTQGSSVTSKSVEHSVHSISDKSSQEKENLMELKKVEDKSSSHEHAFFSIFESKRNKKSGKKEKQDLVAEKEFLEKLKISVKKNESTTSYPTTDNSCSEKRLDTTTNSKTRNDSSREIRSYSDLSQETSDAESIADTDRTASSENYFSASEVPFYKTAHKTLLHRDVKQTSCGTSSKFSKSDADMEIDEQSGNDVSVVNNTKKTFVNSFDDMEVDSAKQNKTTLITGTCTNNTMGAKNTVQIVQKGVIFCEKEIVLEKDSNFKHQNSQLTVKNSTLKEGEKNKKKIDEVQKLNLQSDIVRCGQEKVIEMQSSDRESSVAGVDVLQNDSHSDTEIKIQQKPLDNEFETDSTGIKRLTKTKESTSVLRRSARISSKPDSSVSLCKTNTDTENIRDEIKGKTLSDENTENSKNAGEIEEDNAFSEKILRGNIQCASSKKKKRRVHRSVTSETISSVTSVCTSESASDNFNSFSEETDDSSLSTENTSTSDEALISEKSEHLQKWVCTNKNCRIKMRHLHPKCDVHDVPNLKAADIQKESQAIMTDSNITTPEEMREKAKDLTANKMTGEDYTKLQEDKSRNSTKSLEFNNMSMEPKLVNDKRIQQETNGTVELAAEESIGSSRSLSVTEYSSEGSTSSSGSSTSESSSESESECLDQDTVMEVNEGWETEKSPNQSAEINDRPVEDNKRCTAESNTSSVNKTKEIDNMMKDYKCNATCTLLDDKQKESDKKHNLKGSSEEQGIQVASDTSLSMQNGVTAVESETGTENMGLNNYDRLYIENDARAGVGKDVLLDKHNKEVPSTIFSEDNIQMETDDVKDKTENPEPLLCRNEKEIKDLHSENIANSRKHAVITNENSNVKTAQNQEQANKCNQTSNSGAMNDISRVEKDMDKMNDITTNKKMETVLQNSENDEVNERKETVNKNEISENESEGSFGSNIMSERTVSSVCDDESDFSDTDDSTGSSYTDGSSFSSSDESGTSSSWESRSSGSDSECDSDPEEITCTDNAVKNNNNSDTVCSEKIQGKEISIKDFCKSVIQNETNVKKSVKDTQEKEGVCESQHKVEVTSHSENKMEVDETLINHERNRFSNKEPSQQKCSRVISESSSIDEKTKYDNSMSLQSQEKTSAADKSSKNTTPDRSHLLQNLLKCLQVELKGKESVEDNAGVIECREADLSKMTDETSFVKADSTDPVTVHNEKTVTNEKTEKFKEITSSSENHSVYEEKATGRLEKSVEKTKGMQLENTEVVEINKANVNGALKFGSKLSLSSDMLLADASNIPKADCVSEALLSEQVIKDIEKAKTNKENEHYQETLVRSENNSRNEKIVKENYKTSTSNSDNKEAGQDLHNVENVLKTASLSETSDSEDGSSCGSTHPSDCSTCTSFAESSAESGSDPGSCYESESECIQKKITETDKNTEDQKNADDYTEVGNNIDPGLSVKHDVSELRDTIAKDKENEIGEMNNAADETSSVITCENNPYLIADEMPVFLEETDNTGKQSKQSPSSMSTASEDSEHATPAVKFVNLNVSPTMKLAVSPDKKQNLSPNKGANSQPGSCVKSSSLGVISSVVWKAKTNQEKFEVNELGKTKSATKKGKEKTQLSRKGNKVDTDVMNKPGGRLKSHLKDNCNQKNTSDASKNLKDSSSNKSTKLKKTTEKNVNSKKDYSCKSTKQAKEKEHKTNSKTSLNSGKEASKRLHSKNSDVNVHEPKSKEAEGRPLRRSPRKKPSQMSVTDTELKSKYGEKIKKNGNVLDIHSSDKKTKPDTQEDSLKINSIKSSNRKRDLKSVEKATRCSRSSADVEKTTENNTDSCKVTRNTSENDTVKLSGYEKRKNESKRSDTVPTNNSVEYKEKGVMNTSTRVPAVGKISAKGEASNTKVVSKDRGSNFEKRNIHDTTRVLTEKIMKLKVEQNMLEKELAEKHRQEKAPFEVKSRKNTKENMLKSKVTTSGSSRSSNIKPLTVALAANGPEDVKSRKDTTRTGSLDKHESLTFEEKLGGCEGYLSNSKSADKVSKKSAKDPSLSLSVQTASLKTFTIPKLSVAKKCSSQIKKNERVTKCKSESSLQRNTKHSSGNLKEKRHTDSKISYSAENKKNIKFDKSKNKEHIKQKTNPVKKHVISSDSDSSVSDESSESDSHSSGEVDNDALVKAVFGSSDTSGNSGKSLTLDDLCKTRSSEDTDDIVKDISLDVMMTSDVCKDAREPKTKLPKERAEVTRLNDANFQKRSKCFDQIQANTNRKHSSDSKCFEMTGRESEDPVKNSKHTNRKIDNFLFQENVKDNNSEKSLAKNQELKERSKSVKCNQGLRKSLRISAVNTHKTDSSPNKTECPERKCEETGSKELRRSNRTPKKSDREICESRNVVRHFEISDKNPILNKIVSPKKHIHHFQTDSEEECLGKTKGDLVCKTKEFENHSRKETKGVPILLLEESTIDGIDYHDDVTFDTDSFNVAAVENEIEESSEEEINEKGSVSKEQTDSDHGVEEGEISDSDDENVTYILGQRDLKETSQRCNEMTPKKLNQKAFSNKGGLSPVQFPSSPSRSCSDRESSCQCSQTTCIHRRIGISDKRQSKRYRSDSDSCSDTNTLRPRRKMRRDHPSIRKRSRSSDRTDSPRDRRREKSDRFLDCSRRRSVSPRHRFRRSMSKSPHRCRQYSRSRSTSPRRGRRRRSRSQSPVRSRLIEKNRQATRSRQRYRNESDAGSPRQHRRRSNSGDTSPSVDSSYRGKNNRSHKERTLETTINKSLKRSNVRKSTLNRDDRNSSSENIKRKAIQGKSLSTASATDESSDEENERFSKLKSEKRNEILEERKASGNSPWSRRVRDRGRNSRVSSNYTSEKRRKSRSRSLNRKRKRCISESGSEIESDIEKKIDKRQCESNGSGSQSHKRSRTDKSIREDDNKSRKR